MKSSDGEKKRHHLGDDHFTRLMFPISKTDDEKKAVEQSNDDKKDDLQNHPLFSMMEHVNYDELMQNIDVFLESTKGFKPLFQKMSPFVEKFLKQKS